MERFEKPRPVAGYIDENTQHPRDERLFAEGVIGVAITHAFKRLRVDAGITRAELAKRVGRTERYIQKLENGAYERCTLPALRTFARALGHDIDVHTMLHHLEKAIYSYDVGVDELLDYELKANEPSGDEVTAPFAVPGGTPRHAYGAARYGAAFYDEIGHKSTMFRAKYGPDFYENLFGEANRTAQREES